MGIAPSGAIIFVSQLHDGSTCDKEIANRSEFLKKRLWSDGDSVMADRGFTMHDELARVRVSLNVPAFLCGRDYLTKAEIKLSLPSPFTLDWANHRIKTYSITGTSRVNQPYLDS